MANGKRISYEEGRVRIQHLVQQRDISDIERAGDMKYFEAAALARDGKKADELRRKMHENLDTQLDTITEMYSMMGIVNPPEGEK